MRRIFVRSVQGFLERWADEEADEEREQREQQDLAPIAARLAPGGGRGRREIARSAREVSEEILLFNLA